MAIFNSYMFVYQRVTEWQPVKFAHHKWISLGQAPRCEVGKAEGGGWNPGDFWEPKKI